MPLRTFETEDAVYHLGLDRHDHSSAPLFENLDFSDLDLMVFEDCGSNQLPNGLKDHIQYKELYEIIQRENPDLPIFGIDVSSNGFVVVGNIIRAGGLVYALNRLAKIIPKKNRQSRRQFFRNTLGLIGSLGLLDILQSFPDYELGWASNVYDLKSNVLPTPAVGFRDAVTAKKTLKYLVPRYRSAERKPKIGLLYGTFHSGIEQKLKHPEIADATINAYRALNYHDPDELNDVREIKRYPDGTITIRKHDCKLFS